MSFFRRRGGALVGIVLVLLLTTVSVKAQPVSDGAVNAAAQWLVAQQSVGGSWGAVPELSSRDTARTLIALQASGASLWFAPLGPAAVHAQSLGLAWLATQPLDANQLLAEQAIALAVAKTDNSAILARLLQQRSVLMDFGGFADHSGDAYDSALAIQALATNETLYGPSISTIVTALLAHQNADGGWGIDGGFISNPLLTAEVLLAFGSTRRQIAPPVAIAGAQAYLAHLIQSNGSIAGDVLTTAVGFRALVLSRASMIGFAGSQIAYLRQTQGSGGYWGAAPGDAYITARVIEAFSVNKPNFTINPGDFTLSPSSVVEGGVTTATVKVSNIGPVVSSGQIIAIYTVENRTTALATVFNGNIGAGSFATATLTVPSTGLLGTRTLVAVADAQNQVDEAREDDNEATATLTITGKPDLQIYKNDISTSPAHPAPGQPAQILATIHNGGQSDAPQSGYAVYEQVGSGVEVLLVKATLPAVVAGQAQTISVPITFSAGSYGIRVVADPDNVVNEVLETNNQATNTVTVATSVNVDFRMSSVVVTPARPAPGTPVTITALLQNTGIDAATASVVFYDGVPNAGGVVIGTQSVGMGGVVTVPLQVRYTTTASSQVIYAVADPDNLVPELDETNNSAFALLTDQVADLEVTTDGIVMPRQLPSFNNPVSVKFVVKNRGLNPATHVEVAAFDDLPQLGGVQVVDTFIDVPAQGSVVVPATWILRAGQRLATVTVNASRSVPEPNYANNRATRPYVVNSQGPEIGVTGTFDLSQLVVDPLTLKVSGSVIMTQIDAGSTPSFVVTVFEDVDGDRFYNPEVDNALGSALVTAGTWGSVTVGVSGSVRFAPGHLMMYVDSGNAVNEPDETNNLLDVYHPSCAVNFGRNTTPTAVKWATNNPSHTLSPVARAVDTNGDGVIDNSDAVVMFVATAGGIIARRGDTGAILWSVPGLDTSGRQISPLVADLGDGKPVVIAHTDIDPATGATHQHRLVALNAADGSRRWTSPPLDRDPQWEVPHASPYSYGGAPAVADLNGDGVAEIITGRTVLNGSDGTIKWTGTGGAGRAWNDTMDLYDRFFPDQEAPIVVDIDGDGRPEVVAGNTVYRADGSILWQRSDLSDGYTCPVWLGTDTKPHICLVAHGTVTMLNSDGTTLWGPTAVPGGSYLGGAPTAYMVNGTFGYPSVAVANDGYLTSFNAASGAIVWSTQVSRNPALAQGSTTNSATAAANVDGFENLFYAGLDQFVIVNGTYGSVQYADTSVSANPYYPSEPVVADIDDDGHLEVVVPDRNQVRIYGDGSWMGAPPVFNEASYHTVNTDPFAKVQTPEVPSSFSRTHFRATQVVYATNIAPQPNLTVSYPRVDSSQFPASSILIARVGNNGWATAAASVVDFYQPGVNGAAPTHLGSAPTGVLTAGAYQDVAISIDNPSAMLSFYAVVDVPNTLAECDESDNKSVTTSLHLSADIAAVAGSLGVSDARPRQGDSIDLAAEAYVTGARSASSVTAQFFLGDPASGGTPISPVLPVTVVRTGSPAAVTVAFHWSLVAAPIGQQTIYVMFDPQNLIPEDDETNNTLSASINVTTPDPIRSLSGTVTLTPPAEEAGRPVGINLLVQNIGNVPLSNVVMSYSVTGGPATGATGSATVASIAKNSFASVVLGSFTPSANGTYTVTVVSSDPATSLLATPKTITIGPFATGLLTATPSQVPISFPLVQARAHVSRTNTIVVPDDPLLPLVQTHIQLAVNFESGLFLNPPNQDTCMKCHVHPLGLISIESALAFPGVTVPAAVEPSVVHTILGALDPATGLASYDLASMLSALALSHASNASDVAAYLPPLAGVLLKVQLSDGSWPMNDDGTAIFDQVSWVSPEGQTLMAVEALTRIYDRTKDPRLLAAILHAEQWLYVYDYTRLHTDTCERAARVAIALNRTLPYLDSGTATLAQARIRVITSFLRALQNADGSFGDEGNPFNRPITRTAQSLYAITLDGAGPSDPAVRAATLWLINQQGSAGSWPATNQTPAAIDQTSWAITALSLAWGRGTSLDVDFHMTIPVGTDLVSTAPTGPPAGASTSTQELVWHLPNVTESGSDVFANLMLNGLANGTSRPIATDAWLTYNDPYSGQAVRQSLPVPTITGTSPVGLAVSTDKSVYGANQSVSITETINNAFSGLTNDLVIRDASGTAVATVANAESLSGLPALAFPGWHYAVPLTVTAGTGTNRSGQVSLDVSQKLAELGVTGTFDTNSLRVTSDAQPAAETYFSWNPSAMASAGTLTFSIPDSVATGAAYSVHAFFDITENGFKPVSLYNHSVVTGGGLTGAYYRLDTTHWTGQALLESQVAFVSPPIATRIESNLNLGNNDFPFAQGLPQDNFVTLWTGAIYAPVTGTYNFDLASDDGSWLTIDGVQLINDGGNHGTTDAFGSIALTAGLHTVRVTMYDAGGGQSLSLKWAPPGQGYAMIPAQYLYPTVPIAATAGSTQIIGGGPASKTYTWNTASTAAAPYTAEATIRQNGGAIATSRAALTITPSSQVMATVATGSASYDPGTNAQVTGSVQYASGNVPLSSLSAILSVTDPLGASTTTRTTAIASLLPGQSVNVSLDWSVGNAAPGSYSASLVVKDSSGNVLVQKSVPFSVRSTSQDGKGITGTITATAPSVQGRQPAAFTVSLTNAGNAGITNGTFAIRAVDPVAQTLGAETAFTATIAAGATITVAVSLDTTPLSVQTYDVWLVSTIGTTVTLAKTSLTVTASPVVTASVITDKASYDAGDTVHETTTIQYTSGASPLTNVTVTATVTNAANATVSSGSSTITSLVPGATTTTTFNWPVTVTAPGTYTTTIAVKDGSGNLLTQSVSTFTITSSATTGKGVTGTLTTSASVIQGDALPLSATITDNGNAPLTNAPFAVKIASDTLTFTASVPLAGSTTTTLTYSTAALPPGSYTATLVSTITGTPVTLATASFTVNPVPVVMTATFTTDKSSYDAGDTVHEATTVQYTSGPSALANITVTATVTNGAHATVSSGSSTITSLVPGATATTTFNWPVTMTAPGTYTTTVIVKDGSGAVLVQSSSTFTITSTATTGKGVTGTLTTSASVIQGDALPLSATITDNGNAPLTNAPFAVKIASDTLSFTASVPLAGSTTSTLTYNTLPLNPGSYTATLVSMITGTPVTLATASFTVNAVPVVVTATVTTDKSSYDAGDTLHETTTVQYTSGLAPLTNVSVTTTVTNAANAPVATGSTTIASLAPHSTTTTTFDWPVGVTASGTYTATTFVKDNTGAILAQSSSTFTITSTATTGEGVTGTLTTSASVIQGDALPLSATITDNGNAPLTNAPFAVKIASDTLSFTASVPLAGSTTSTLTYNTLPLNPGSYTATLVSMITGTPVTLATASFTVNPVPVVVTATVTTDKSSYDAGDTLHETTTVQYTSGASPLANVTVTATVTNGANAIVSSGSSTVTSLAPGATTTTAFNWPVTVTAPGTYTSTIVVKDGSGAILAQSSSTFTITSTATSGKGVTGTLTASASVNQGEALPLSATITDNGNAALTSAPFAVKIASDTLSFTASVPLAGSTTSALTYSTAALNPGNYTATLVSMITGTPVTLATASFRVTPAATQPTLAVTLSPAPRVLLRQECNVTSNGVDAGSDDCTNGSPFFTKTLNDAGIPFSLLRDGESLLTRLRAGGYTEVTFARPDDSKITDEVIEMIHAGAGLIATGNHPDQEPKLSPAVGVKFYGKIVATSTLLNVLATPIDKAGTLTVNGNGVTIGLTAAKAVANIASTGLPAMAYNVYGSGRTAVMPFNVELTPSSDMAALLLGTVNYVSRPSSSDARGTAALDVAVTAPAGGSQSVSLTVTLPQGLTLIAANPAATTGTTWSLTVAGGTTSHVLLRIRLADAIGTYTVSATISMAGQPLATKTLALPVTADRAGIESALTSELAALASAVAPKDKHSISDAQSELAAVTAVGADTASENAAAVASVTHILKIAGDLDALSIDTTAARRDTDRLFLWWESRIADQKD